MTKYQIKYTDLHNTLYNQNFMDNHLPDESVQMVVTSPPYWGLRKYSGGLEQMIVWGDMAEFVPSKKYSDRWYFRLLWRAMQKGGVFNRDKTVWIGAYGLEPTPEMYVQHTIEILREIRRVLRKDGVVFWNIGDSYASKGGGYSDNGSRGNTSVISAKTQAAVVKGKRIARGSGRWGGGNNPSSGYLKEKDLCLIPSRVAIAAQRDGWGIRSDIIWSKSNPMPESVTDRPTNSHEHILMLTKSAKYYWDQEAVREPQTGNAHPRGTENGNEVYQTARGSYKDFKSPVVDLPAGRNLRSVWTFPTQPYPEAHFAVFPEKLPELCIKAATPEVGCCSKCGSPWTRVLEKGLTDHSSETDSAYEKGTSANRLAKLRQSARANGGEYVNANKTLGWEPQCKCNAEKVPSIVLDPFAGAGTSLWVAKKLNRKAIGFEISEEYCELIIKRIRQQGMFIKKMIKRGFDTGQIFECWHGKTKKAGHYKSMAFVNEDIQVNTVPGYNKFANQKYGNVIQR